MREDQGGWRVGLGGNGRQRGERGTPERRRKWDLHATAPSWDIIWRSGEKLGQGGGKEVLLTYDAEMGPSSLGLFWRGADGRTEPGGGEIRDAFFKKENCLRSIPGQER